MMLVFYIILGIIICAFILTLILYLSKLEISIKNLYMNSENKQKNNNDILVTIGLKLGRYRWLKLRMNKNKMANIYVRIKKIEYKNSKMKNKIEKTLKGTIKDKKAIGVVSNFKVKLEEFKAEISIGTEDPIITSYLVAFVAISISNILPHISEKASKVINYKILPIYRQKNMYLINLDGIFSINISNLIKVFWKLRKIVKTKKEDYKYTNTENINKRKVQTV